MAEEVSCELGRAQHMVHEKLPGLAANALAIPKMLILGMSADEVVCIATMVSEPLEEAHSVEDHHARE